MSLEEKVARAIAERLMIGGVVWIILGFAFDSEGARWAGAGLTLAAISIWSALQEALRQPSQEGGS